jgi:hypothetical protein
MSNDTVLFLALSQNTNHPIASKGEERIQQYINGIEKLFEYDFKDKADVVVCDNTTSHLDKRIIRVLPWDTEYYTYENNAGGISKSIGLYYKWKSCQNIMKSYKWIIHFEPRQILKKHDFFDSFFKNKRNIFNVRRDHFWTGLFSIGQKEMLDYTNYQQPNGSIEFHLFKFMEKYKYEREDLHILWNDVAKNTWIDI